ncbi:hypothetical protein ACHAXT_011165 [Thalassiosira profunda]
MDSSSSISVGSGSCSGTHISDGQHSATSSHAGGNKPSSPRRRSMGKLGSRLKNKAKKKLRSSFGAPHPNTSQQQLLRRGRSGGSERRMGESLCSSSICSSIDEFNDETEEERRSWDEFQTVVHSPGGSGGEGCGDGDSAGAKPHAAPLDEDKATALPMLADNVQSTIGDCNQDECGVNALMLSPIKERGPSLQPQTPGVFDEGMAPPTTVTGADCMGQFSKVTGPSPAKLNVGDMSLDTTIDSPHSLSAKTEDLDRKENQRASMTPNDGEATGDDDAPAEIRPKLLFRPDILSRASSASTTPRDGTTPSSELPVQPTTVSAVDCMSQFSSLKSPSPMKINHLDFDVSMDTTVCADDSMLVVDANAEGVAKGSCAQRSLRQPLDDVTAKQTKLSHPSTASSRMRNQASNISAPTTSLLQQEYNVDHSCSTPLERLVRDIGNTFRQWHVHQGCDWHVSLDWAQKMGSHEEAWEEEEEEDGSDIPPLQLNDQDDVATLATGETSLLSMSTEDDPVKCMSMDLCERGFASRSRKISSIIDDGDGEQKPLPQSISPTKPKHRIPDTPPRKSKPPAPPKIVVDESPRGARCIRTKKIQLQTVGYTHDDSDARTLSRRRYTIPLVLKLWDAPYFPAKTASDGCAKDHASEETRSDDVPRSMNPGISPSSYSLLGELGYLSPCGTERPRYNPWIDLSSPSSSPSGKDAESIRSLTAVKTGLTEDLSSMFNIGQHITLCLDLSEVHRGSTKSDVESLYNDLHAYIEQRIYDASEARRQALSERHRRQKQLQQQNLKSLSPMRRTPREQEQPGHTEGRDSSNGNGDGAKNPPLVEVGTQSMSPMSHDGVEEGDLEDAGSEHSSHDSYTDDSEDDMSSLEDDLRLSQEEIHAEVTASLTSILQTALTLAASENDCSIPVFGMWGDYSGESPDSSRVERRDSSVSLSWIPRGVEKNLLQIVDKRRIGQEEEEDSANDLLLSSPVLSGTCCQSGALQSSHQAYFIPQQALPLHLSTLNGLANVLLAQCPACDNAVTLAAARHCYHWNDNMSEFGEEHDWRLLFAIVDDGTPSAVKSYQRKCKKQALLILERASSSSKDLLHNKSVPMWGPSEGNPLQSFSASVSWGVIAAREEDAVQPPPLLQLPLKIRSTNFASTPSELLDMEYAIQSAALNPIGVGVAEKGSDGHEFGPREPIFLASAEFDLDAPCATLSANTRCVLAALLRCGALGRDVLPGHLTKREVLSKLAPQISAQTAVESSHTDSATESEKMLRKAVDLAKVGPVTRRLIDALDWGDIEMNLSSAEIDRGIGEALDQIQSTSYPAPPEEVFSFSNANNKFLDQRSKSKGTPPGRLLSILFAHMARLRTPPSMMRLWLAFVEELRTRWDHNESLPNLGFVPGLDNDAGAQQGQPHWGLQKADARVLGHRAHLAAFVNSSEPEADRNSCIINQKLQVFNICIECKMSTEALHEEQMRVDGDNGSQASMSVNNNSSDDDEFFDPQDGDVTVNVSGESDPDNIEEMLKRKASSMLSPRHNRVGARCPVPDALPLIESGDQLYAPYLQRTMPMTDEEEQKRSKLLGLNTSLKEERPSIKSRIAIAQRLQKPKLLSDMSSFKAANEGAIFEDFVRWYGNPENPLCEEVNGETARQALEYRSSLPPAEAKTLALQEASEAIAILMSLRAFWEDTWEEVEPCPAFEQEPLFDPYSTVEMALHSFETIHPTLLMGQVLAVQLSNARFVIESAAGPAAEVRSVAKGLRDLKTAIDVAIEKLTEDSADGMLDLAPKQTADDSDPLAYVSTSTVSKCEEACNAIGEMEVLLSRALPLVQKFPGADDLVDLLLRGKAGRFILLTQPSQRSAFLASIKRHQAMGPNPVPEARPAMQEYVLRTTDPSSPCQLSARLVPNLDEDQSASLFHGSLLLALTKCSRG